MSRKPRPDYDSSAFRAMWFSPVPLREIASAYGVSIVTVWRAGRRRGLPYRNAVHAARKAA